MNTTRVWHEQDSITLDEVERLLLDNPEMRVELQALTIDRKIIARLVTNGRPGRTFHGSLRDVLYRLCIWGAE